MSLCRTASTGYTHPAAAETPSSVQVREARLACFACIHTQDACSRTVQGWSACALRHPFHTHPRARITARAPNASCPAGIERSAFPESFIVCVQELTTRGKLLSQAAERRASSASAPYCLRRAPPLRALSGPTRMNRRASCGDFTASSGDAIRRGMGRLSETHRARPHAHRSCAPGPGGCRAAKLYLILRTVFSRYTVTLHWLTSAS